MPVTIENALVRIYASETSNGPIAGTGFLVSERWVLTCAHVIQSALGMKASDTTSVEFVYLDFPLLKQKNKSSLPLKGKIYFWQDPDSDDIAGIEIIDELPPGTGPVRILGIEDTELKNHSFSTFGFPWELKDGSWTEGDVLGREGGGRVQLQKSKTEGLFINKGFSGSPIWDKKLNGVVGMTATILKRDNPDTAFMIPATTILEKWSELLQLPNITSGWSNIDLVIQGYSQEIVDEYREYWNKYVSVTKSDQTEVELFHPVGQTFQGVITVTRVKNSEARQNQEKQSTTTSESVQTGGIPPKPDVKLEREENLVMFSSLSSICSTIFDTTGSNFVVLTGEPGSGKTLSLHHFMAEQALKIQNTPGAIPIYIPLNRFTEGIRLDELIHQTLQSDMGLDYHRRFADNFEKIINGREIILLLDGLNEIPKSSIKASVYKQLLFQIEIFSKKYRTKGIISTREGDFSRETAYPKISIKPFEQLGIEEALTLFIPQHAAELRHLLKKEPALQELAANPFRLKALCQIYHPGMNIPRTPSALYQTFIDVLEKREKLKQNKTRSLVGWSKSLSKFAYELTEKSTTSISSQEAPNILRANISAFGESIGVLRNTQDAVSFVHQQLQEYFAAQHLAGEIQRNKTYKKLFADLALKTSWDEPFILLTDILHDGLLDEVIEVLIESDIFLAAKCVGRNPNKLVPATRGKLANGLEQLVRLSLNRFNSDILAKATAALGASRVEESLAVLAKPDLESDIYAREGSAYLNAIAQIDTPVAVRLITENLARRIIQRDHINQDEIRSFIFALASMRSSEAMEFLVENLQSPILYPAIIRAFSEVRTPDFLSAYSDLLHGSRVSKNDVSDKVFEYLCKIARKGGMSQLVPDLLQYPQEADAVEALVQLNSGQQMIDDFAGQLRYYVHFLNRAKDLRVFDLSSAPDSVMLWANLLKLHGQSASDRYTNLLLNCVQNAPKASEKEHALLLLALLDVRKTLPLLSQISNQVTVKDNDDNEKPVDGKLLRKLTELFQTPGNFGISRKPLEKLAVQVRNIDNKTWKLTKDIHPNTAILEASGSASLIKEYIHAIVKSQSSTLQYYPDDYYEVLLALNDEELLSILVHDLLFTLNSDQRENERLFVTINGLIKYGQKDPTNRQKVITEMGHLVQHTDRSMQLAAIEVLSELEASEHCDVLLSYLSDRTWQVAYVIVDHIGQMRPNAEFTNKVVERLTSRVPGQKYFALLTLGSLKKVECIPTILQHWRDTNEFIERAAMWALAEIGPSEFNVMEAFSEGMDSPSGWVRLEAARSAGLLGLKELVNKLIFLLSDPDLRVVEQAAIALGHLQEAKALPALLLALKKSPVPPEHYQENVWRAEDRIQNILAASCVKCNIGTADNDFDLGMKTDKKTLLMRILTGEMNRKIPMYRSAPVHHVHKTAHKTSQMFQQHYNNMPHENLRQIILLSPDPEQRRAAIEVVKAESFKKLPDEIRYDPNPSISIDYYIASNKEAESNYRFTGIPIFDLSIAEAMKVEKPSAVLKISDKWDDQYHHSNNAALNLARYFPERYRITELSDILLEIGDSAVLNQEGAELLAHTLDKDQLQKFIRTCRRTSWQSAYYSSLQLKAIDALVQRRTWSLAWDLMETFGSGFRASKEYNGFFLAALGIYQAGDWMASDAEFLEEDVLVKHIVQAELQGIVPGPAGDQNEYYFDNHQYLGKFPVMLANLCCELNDPNAVQTWGAIASYRPYDADTEWITRGLRKWGLEAVYFLIQNYGNRSSKTVLKICRELRGDYKESKEYFSREFSELDQHLIEQLVEAEADLVFQEWLTHSSPAIQLFGLAVLMRRKSSAVETELINILKSMPAALPFLIEYAEVGNLPALITSLHDLRDYQKTTLSPLSEAIFKLIEEQLKSNDTNTLEIFITLIGKSKLRAFSKKLVYMLEHESKEDSLIKVIIRALAAMGNKSVGTIILPHLDSPDVDIVLITLQALQALAYPIKADSVEKLMKHAHHEIRGVAYVLCGMLKIVSLGDLLYRSYHDLVNIYTTRLFTDHNKQIDQNISTDFPALHFNLSWDKEILERLINNSSLGLYLLGRLDHYRFFTELPAYRESGLFSFTLLSSLFSKDIFYFGGWTSAGSEYRWLEFCTDHQLKEIIVQDINQLSWLKTKEKVFFTELFKNTLPDLAQVFEGYNQKTMRRKQRNEIITFTARHGYTIKSIAILIEKAANIASKKAMSHLQSLSGVNEPRRFAAKWKKSLVAIQSEEDVKKISWDVIESSAYLWLSNMIDLEVTQNDDSQQLWEAISLMTLFGNEEWDTSEIDVSIGNLRKSNTAKHLKLKASAQKIYNFCYTREMIYILGIELMDILSGVKLETNDSSEARRWIKQWSKKITFKQSSALENLSQRLEDGQKENPFVYVYERPNRHRRIVA